jgi:hypothetical protein
MFIGITHTGKFQLDPFESVVMIMIEYEGSSVRVMDF